MSSYPTQKEYTDTGSWGMLLSLDLHECNRKTIRDAEAIRQYVIELCEKIQVQRFGECQVIHFADHNEDVAGFSMVQLIETSLISGHFANKTNAAYLDIFSCTYFDAKEADSFSRTFFEAERGAHNILLRK